ncbi:MAG TPA: SsrA-binding protein SmpB [Flavobacteriales bacterium]|nr:SsrA-binding protein SmpB [Flavobacteriales bacterium]HRO40224.1 SsrA-binding protein SmpB [Flavobacteriales bacterium]HRP82405.1 SsrA-binding protein SmpB [Flavobacteriales bacterium]HRQ84308.1 SsrA-binding protein SmpB [Flavobacteriales bacterium]
MAAPVMPEVKNRRAAFDYSFLDTFVCGIVLVGSEVKSLRLGDASITEAFCTFIGNELYLRNMRIQPYEKAKNFGHEPIRDRKLLLQRKELTKLQRKLKDQGITVIPVRTFFAENGKVKVEIALAKGKKTYDKRESLKAKDVKRDMERGR